MVVDAERHPAQQRLGVLRQHAGGCHVRRDHGVAFLCAFGGQALYHPGKTGADPGVFQNIGGFAQAPQPQAQGRGAAQGVPVRPHMGQNYILIVVQQKGRRVNPLQALRHG